MVKQNIKGENAPQPFKPCIVPFSLRRYGSPAAKARKEKSNQNQ